MAGTADGRDKKETWEARSSTGKSGGAGRKSQSADRGQRPAGPKARAGGLGGKASPALLKKLAFNPLRRRSQHQGFETRTQRLPKKEACQIGT